MFFRNILTAFPAPLLCAAGFAMALASCVEPELGNFGDDEIPEGEARVHMNLRFECLGASNPGASASRSLNGDALNALDDLCLVAFDSNDKLMEGFPIEITREGNNLEINNETDRKPEDAANGQLAETQTAGATFDVVLPYGKYYLYAVSNLGARNSETGALTKTSYAALTESGALNDAMQKRTKFLNYATPWSIDNKYNNFQMLGYFTNQKAEKAPVTGVETNNVKVTVDSPEAYLHAWLRRSCSKVTIDFDGSELRDNIHVYIRRATIHNLPKSCKLGMPNRAANMSEVYTFKEDTQTSKYVPTKDADEICYGTTADYHNWPNVSKGSPTIKLPGIDSLHAQNAPSLFLYENMKGSSTDEKETKEQIASDNGLVIGSTDVEDNMLGASYIEVEGYYVYSSSGEVSQGPIIYRFMLGENETDNFDVERNRHIKLTLKLRGNGNDVDWHIQYQHSGGFEYKDPYYVSYLYNHQSTIHFRYTPPKGKEVVKVTAEIVANNWWPDDPKASYLRSAMESQSPIEPSLWDRGDVLNAKFGQRNIYTEADLAGRSDEEKTALRGKVKYLGNGWLSLWETNKMNYTLEETTGNTGALASSPVNLFANDRVFYGIVDPPNGAGSSYGFREYLFDSNGASTSDATNSGRNSYQVEPARDGSYALRFNIPVFTRAKNLMKESAYSGNNSYEGSTRTAIIKISVYLEGQTTPIEQNIRVQQVSRVVNPKGIYRRSGNNEDFNVTLMELKDAGSSNYIPINSDGPWLAEVIGDDRFISLNGHRVIRGSTGSDIAFKVLFNKLNHSADDKVHNAIIRVRYNNYSCVHLIFVRQGYASQALFSGGAEWHTTNMITQTKEALDPRDEGSMFKYGNPNVAIDVKSNQGFGFRPNLLGVDDFTTGDNLFKANDNRTEPSNDDIMHWADFNGNRTTGFSEMNVATMDDIAGLFRTPNVEHGFGVLYADGATQVQNTVEGAFGYYRYDEDCAQKGMRGVFIYYWDGDYNTKGDNARNIFFPIGMSGFGHRRSYYSHAGTTENLAGTLRYSAGRDEEMTTNVEYQPQFFDLYRRPGALYWGKSYKTVTAVTGKDMAEAIALDLNYYTYDINSIGRNSLQKHSQWSACTDDSHIDACFLRCVGHSAGPTK